jgi:hypothetical protein
MTSAAPQSENEMVTFECCEVGLRIFELLAGKDEALLVRRDASPCPAWSDTRVRSRTAGTG